jgi:tripartite-type tricarboxylate transporter receptor subunit TctC
LVLRTEMLDQTLQGIALKALLALLFAALAAVPGSASAQSYPSRTITIIVPFPAGGSVDALARMIGPKISERLGQPVVIENRSGASGMVGMGAVAKAEPDGYTILNTPVSIAINPALYRKLAFNTEKDFVPITQSVSSALVLVANPNLKVSTVAELVALAKERPGKLNFGSSGVADPLQLGMEMLRTATNTEMLAVPYKGQSPMFLGLLGGEVDVGFVTLQLALEPIRTGQVRALAVAGPQRSPALPDVPTVAEAGVPGFEISSWHGFFAPAGTPREIVDLLQREIARAVHLPDVRERIEATGNEAVGSTPEVFDAMFHAEILKFKKIVQDAHIPYQD